MATVTNWVTHLTTDVDSEAEGIQVAGEIYPFVGTEWLWLLIAIVFWLTWHFKTSAGETEEHNELAAKGKGPSDYKKNIADW